MALMLLIVFVVAIIVIWNVYATKKRKEYLLNKYGNTGIVEKIINRYF
jgi:cbb3-type cytochrome oxidase subunit 3